MGWFQNLLVEKSVSVRLLHEKLEAEALVERQQARERWAAELATVLADDLRCADAHAPRLAEAYAGVEAARAQVEAAQQQYNLVYAERRLASLEADRRCNRLKKQLIDSASPLIGAFVDTMQTLAAQCHQYADSVTKKDVDGRSHIVWSNTRSITARLDAIRRACETGVALQFTALDEAAIAARLEALQADIPEVEPRPATWAA